MAKAEVKPQYEAESAKETASSSAILVNHDKVARAKDIVALVTGKRHPKDGSELDRKEHFAQILAEADVDPKGKDAVQFVYEQLGGLVRTPHEQAEAEAHAAELRKKNKKRAIEA